MIERGVVASVQCFTNVLQALAERGDMEQATQIVGKLRAAGVVLDAPIYNVLVVGAIRAGDVDGAHSWADDAAANGIRVAKGVRSQLCGHSAFQTNHTHSAPFVLRSAKQEEPKR